MLTSALKGLSQRCKTFTKMSYIFVTSQEWYRIRLGTKIKKRKKLNQIYILCLTGITYLWFSLLFESDSKILAKKNINWKVSFIDQLLEINQFVPDSFPSICYSIYSRGLQSSLWRAEIDTLDKAYLFEFAFSSIQLNFKLLDEELSLVKELLWSQRTRFNLSDIYLHFRRLSDWLSILDLWADWQELRYIDFKYFETDVQDEQEVIKTEIRAFKSKFGFIQKVKIYKR